MLTVYVIFMGLIKNTQFSAIDLLVTFKKRFIQLKMSLHTQLFSGYGRLRSKLSVAPEFQRNIAKKFPLFFCWRLELDLQ